MEDATTDDQALKKRLLKRIALAAFILACLTATLVVFDSINVPPPPEQLPSSAPTVAATPAPGEVPPLVKLEDTVPERSSAAASLPLEPLPNEKPLTKPATGQLATLRASEPDALPSYRPLAAVEPARSPSSSPAAVVARGPQAATSRNPTSSTRPFGLQLGVFSNLDNAEELRARLEKHGIPATIEARVRVGPFATRAEANAARAKLQELGIKDSLLIAVKERKAPHD
ncbi:MAG: SPOR domain-containing protein [Sulfuritalea sp.]|nr:SPOR domain-containing protein [Sulfuritalea sp.]